jgi:hypothetical protein
MSHTNLTLEQAISRFALFGDNPDIHYDVFMHLP